MQKKQALHDGLWGLGLVALYLFSKGGFGARGMRLLLILGDAFAIAGVLLLLFAGIVALSRGGVLDWIGYGVEVAKWLLARAKDEEFISFYDYQQQRQRPDRPVRVDLFIGGAYFLTGIAYSVLYSVL